MQGDDVLQQATSDLFADVPAAGLTSFAATLDRVLGRLRDEAAATSDQPR